MRKTTARTRIYIARPTTTLTRLTPAVATAITVGIRCTYAVIKQQIPKPTTQTVARIRGSIGRASIAYVTRITYVTHSILNSFLCI